MDASDLTSEIIDSLGFEPTSDQLKAVETFSNFMFMKEPNMAMLLCGSAGTGKTSIASAMVRTLQRLAQKIVLLAPTGRAAKVFSLHSGLPAYTIHRKIYRQRSFEGLDTAFNLAENKQRNTLFVVDEASMISNQNSTSANIFGSGCLLDDLIQYVYSGKNCRMMLIGDKAQLPPVGLAASPALDVETLEKYGLNVVFANMDKVLRQSQDSGILYNATAIRRMTACDTFKDLPRIRFQNFNDLHIVTGSELIESLQSSYSKVGIDDTIVVCRSNKRANIYNQGIRNMILGREEELTVGDRLMVVKNNYYWTDKVAASRMSNVESEESRVSPALEQSMPAFLANGDVAVVRRMAHRQECFGFRFADVSLEFPDYDGYEIDVKIILDSLSSESPALTREEQSQLFAGVTEDYAHIKQRNKRLQKVREDAFYNALQVKYAYAVTCHKAQGGQWKHVYIDQGYMTEEMLSYDYIHWLYTAFTRATTQLFLVNWSEKQKE